MNSRTLRRTATLAAAAMGACAGTVDDRDDAGRNPAPLAAQQVDPAGLPADADVLRPAATNSAMQPVFAAGAPPSSHVALAQGVIVIRAQQASRWLVVRQLAEATGSRLHAESHVLAQARPLSLHWQGSDIRSAWTAVLGQEVGSALACSRARCQVWLVASTPANMQPQAQANVVGGRAEPQSALRGSHASMLPPAAAALTPGADPPGLFPAD